MNMAPATVWRFQDAPAELRALSDNGGDEDWIVEIPSGMAESASCWLNAIDVGYFPRIYPHTTKPGWLVAIGSHA